MEMNARLAWICKSSGILMLLQLLVLGACYAAPQDFSNECKAIEGNSEPAIQEALENLASKLGYKGSPSITPSCVMHLEGWLKRRQTKLNDKAFTSGLSAYARWAFVGGNIDVKTILALEEELYNLAQVSSRKVDSMEVRNIIYNSSFCVA